jgi:hypothetical protein
MAKVSSRAALFGAALVALAVLVEACSKDDSSSTNTNPVPVTTDQSDFITPTNVDVTLFLHDTAMDVEAIEDSANVPVPMTRADQAVLYWELSDANGKVSAAGSMVDPRIATSEFDETGSPNPVNSEKATSALLSVTVPNTGGWLHLYTAPPGATGVHTTSLFGGVEIAKAFIEKITQRFKSDLFPGSTHKPSSKDGSLYDDILGKFGINHVQTASSCGTFSLLFVGDGYTSADQAKFKADVNTAIAQMSSLPVYKDHWNAFNCVQRQLRCRRQLASLHGAAPWHSHAHQREARRRQARHQRGRHGHHRQHE